MVPILLVALPALLQDVQTIGLQRAGGAALSRLRLASESSVLRSHADVVLLATGGSVWMAEPRGVGLQRAAALAGLGPLASEVGRR